MHPSIVFHVLLGLALLLSIANGLYVKQARVGRSRAHMSPQPLPPTTSTEEYQNLFATFASKLLPKSSKAAVNEDAKSRKRKKTNTQKLAQDLENALKVRQWFVTGDIDAQFFSDNFRFEDPDVKVNGIEDYAQGVKRIFNQDRNPQAEIRSVVVSETNPNLITVTWIIRVWVNLAWGIRIRPYTIETDFQIDPDSGLIISQKDRFTVPSYQILIPSIFPFLESLFPKAV